MIELTRLNGHSLYLNCDLIKWAEAAPDTMLTLVDGEKVVIRESCIELVERIRAQRLLLLAELIRLMPEPETLLRATAAASVPGPWSRRDPETQPETNPEGKHRSRDTEEGPKDDPEEEANTG